MMVMSQRLNGYRWLALLMVVFAHHAAHAQAQTPLLYKFTTGYYAQTGADQSKVTGADFNLRRAIGDGNAWLAWYRSPTLDVRQARAGWDHVFSLGPVRIQPSLQAASGGFWGGSLGLETGESWFAGVGLGRTNLRPYVNLNFDPNDAWMASGGYRWTSGQSLSVQAVRDNRQNPDQQHLHLVYRTPMGESDRLTVDLLDKRGTADGTYIRRTGLSVAYDWPRIFARVSYDPKVNFSAQDMWRAQVGLRF
jgi:hypothetical protein